MYKQEIYCFTTKGDVEEDEMVPDRQEDIRPRFHKSKTHHQRHSSENAEVMFHSQFIILKWDYCTYLKVQNLNNDDDDNNDDWQDTEDDDEPPSEWNLSDY